MDRITTELSHVALGTLTWGPIDDTARPLASARLEPPRVCLSSPRLLRVISDSIWRRWRRSKGDPARHRSATLPDRPEMPLATASTRETHPSRVAVIDGAGHFLQLEQPDTVNARILEFLEA